MLQVTEAVRAELQRRLLRPNTSEPLLRITRDAAGGLQLVSGSSHEDDAIVLRNGEQGPVLVASPDVAAALEGAILHFRERPDDHWGEAGLTVLWPRGTQSRTEPSPPAAKARREAAAWRGVRSVFRRRVVARSTTQTASP